jgi:hypothetical protein
VLSVINIALFAVLFDAKHQITSAATQASGILQQIQAQSLTAPLTANVSINDTFAIPIKTVVPIQTTVNVPVTIPVVGQVTIAVPINTQVPIDTTIQVPIKAVVPISSNGDDSSFTTILQQLQDWLAKLARL